MIDEELFDIVDELEAKIYENQRSGKQKQAKLYEGWVDDIKNCEVDPDTAKQLINPELFDAVDELKSDISQCERTPRLSLYGCLFRGWLNNIKNHEVDLDGAKRSAKQAHRAIVRELNR